MIDSYPVHKAFDMLIFTSKCHDSYPVHKAFNIYVNFFSFYINMKCVPQYPVHKAFNFFFFPFRPKIWALKLDLNLEKTLIIETHIR